MTRWPSSTRSVSKRLTSSATRSAAMSLRRSRSSGHGWCDGWCWLGPRRRAASSCTAGPRRSTRWRRRMSRARSTCCICSLSARPRASPGVEVRRAHLRPDGRPRRAGRPAHARRAARRVRHLGHPGRQQAQPARRDHAAHPGGQRRQRHHGANAQQPPAGGAASQRAPVDLPGRESRLPVFSTRRSLPPRSTASSAEHLKSMARRLGGRDAIHGLLVTLRGRGDAR